MEGSKGKPHFRDGKSLNYKWPFHSTANIAYASPLLQKLASSPESCPYEFQFRILPMEGWDTKIKHEILKQTPHT